MTNSATLPSPSTETEGAHVGVEVARGLGEAGDAGGWGTGVLNCPAKSSVSDSMATGGASACSLVLESGEGVTPGLLDQRDVKYLSLQTFSSGKIKKISKKEFTEMFSKGEYYPPEGATIFCEPNSPTFYVYGGARASKPGHWGCPIAYLKLKLPRWTLPLTIMPVK